jgi:hypothetical protein
LAKLEQPSKQNDLYPSLQRLKLIGQHRAIVFSPNQDVGNLSDCDLASDYLHVGNSFPSFTPIV